MGDHTESVQLKFDPKIVSYDSLVKLFWENHSPTSASSRQYRCVIFYHNEEQRKIALASKEKVQAEIGPKRVVQTAVEPVTIFTVAEDYHQKYRMRSNKSLLKTLNLEDPQVLLNSTLAARVNGYLGGYGNVEQFEEEAKDFKLSSTQIAKVKEYIRGDHNYSCARK